MTTATSTSTPSMRSSRPEPSEACPLCNSTQYISLDALTPAEISRTWNEVLVELSASGRACFNSVEKIEHRQCGECGFEYFFPVVAGDSSFYAELQRQFPGYYPRSCPAFDRVIQWSKQRQVARALDVGCGAGYFLDQGRENGLRVAGLDLNAQAVEECRQRGHEVYCGTTSGFAKENPGRTWPLVTAFEVVEHVENPVEFVREAVGLLEPAGWMAISVPNNEGVHRLCELEPHQWPPHHLTRWREVDLRKLGEKAGLTCEEIIADVRHGFHIRYFMELQGRLEYALGRRSSAPSRFLPELLCAIYRLSLMKRWGPRKGLGFTAFYRRRAQ